MKPRMTSKARARQCASGGVEKAKFSAAPGAHPNAHPTVSEESSETEYTSPESSGDSTSNGPDDSVQSKAKEVCAVGTKSADTVCRRVASTLQRFTEPHHVDVKKVTDTGIEDSLRCLGSRPLDLKIYSSFQVGTQKLCKLAESSSCVRNPSAGILGTQDFNVQIRTLSARATRKESYEKDANGNSRVIVDLGDSDEEESQAIKPTAPLCTNCHAMQNKKQHVGELKANEKTVINFENSTCVGQASSLVKPIRKEELREKSQIALEHAGTVAKSTRELCSGSGVRTVAIKRTSQRLRKLILPENEDEPKVSRKDTRKVESEDEASTLSGNYGRKHAEEHNSEFILPDWSHDVTCDLCERGPSLSLGAWFCWCCGAPSQGCTCSPDELWRKKSSLKWKSGKIWRPNDPVYPWTGKVHRLCGLWSCEVYEDEGPTRMLSLYNAVQRGKRIKCSDPDCGLFGATLGCRVRSCKKNYHYPCADRLSVYLKVRMWDGLNLPIACKEHRHIKSICDIKSKRKRKRVAKGGAKGIDIEEALACENKKGDMESEEWKRSKTAGSGNTQRPTFSGNLKGVGTSKQGVKTRGGFDVIDLFSSDEEQSLNAVNGHSQISRTSTPDNTGHRIPPTRGFDMPDRWPEPLNSIPGYLGKKLLCADFSGGLEPIVVPCTNDVDNEPSPSLEYITKSRYQGLPLGSHGCSHPLLKKLAKACKGCAKYDLDDPTAPLSIHIPFHCREDDFREDWQRERMHGRLPYDKYARLLIGTDYNELVECNPRCACGDSCINREMQRGLRTPIELYKTVNKGWAVRTLVTIPRGRFVIEYVGEMLTQDQAHEFGQIYDDLKRSYLYDLDYPESKRKPVFTLDGFHASNVARFINHSCDANLKIYRVYVETTNKWLSHIGMYAMRDIEAGEELSYDYNYGMHNPELDMDVVGEQQSQRDDQENDSTHIKCYCGAHNCRKWLWRPPVTDTDSEDE